MPHGIETLLNPAALLGHPVHVALHRRFSHQAFQRIQTGAQGHFIEQPVQAGVAKPADADTFIAFIPAVALAKSRASMELFGNEVMKRQGTLAPAKGAGVGPGAFGLSSDCLSHVAIFAVRKVAGLRHLINSNTRGT